MKVQAAAAAMILMFGMFSSGCSGDSAPSGTGGSSGGSSSSTSSASSESGASGGSSGSGSSSKSSGTSASGEGSTVGGSTSGGGTNSSASSASTGGGTSCPSVSACGGDVVGIWDVNQSCLTVSGNYDIGMLGVGCKAAAVSGTMKVTGKLTLGADGKYQDNTITTGSEEWTLGPKCLEISGTTTDCDGIGTVLSGTLSTFGFTEFTCADASSGSGCTCKGTINQEGGLGLLYNDLYAKGSYTTSGNTLAIGDAPLEYSYCVKDKTMTVTPTVKSPTVTGTITLQKSGEATGGTGGNGGTTGTGGKGGTTSSGSTTSSAGATGSPSVPT